jgi:hypothetical protein
LILVFVLRGQLILVLPIWKGKEMKSLILVTVLLAAGLIGNYSTVSAGDKADANDSIFKSYGFPSYPGLTHLCQRRVYGSGTEITWDAFASTAEPAEIVDYYLEKLGKAGFTKEDKGGAWRLPAGDPHPKRILDVMAAGTDNPSRDCEEHPPADSHAIIVISKMGRK